MRLNIIHGNRGDRFPNLMKELNSQFITDYELWPSVYLPSIKASINAAHKQIVEYARLAEWDYVAIAEDDLQFTSLNSWDYFLKNIPPDFDMYLSMVYLGQPDENNVVKEFTGMTLYVVAKKFYDKFLSVPDDDHIDRLLGGLGRFIVCDPFVAKQYNGFSSNTGKDENYDDLLKERKFLLI